MATIVRGCRDRGLLPACAGSLAVALAAGGLYGQCEPGWRPMGDGVNGMVLSLAVMPGGDVVVGGLFQEAAGTEALRIARFDGTDWHPVGGGMNHMVRALGVSPAGELIAGGEFTEAGGVSADRIARWDGTQWHPIGGGMDRAVRAILFLPSGEMVVGGDFLEAGGMTVNRIARWDGQAWSGFGGGMDRAVLALERLPNGDIVAGGSFMSAGGVPVSRIASWDGSTWAPVGFGVSGDFVVEVRTLTALDSGDLLVGGTFASAGFVDADNVALWDGVQWHAMDQGVSYPGAPSLAWGPHAAIDLGGGDAIVGGEFSHAGTLTVNHVVHWDRAQWSALDGGLNGHVHALGRLPGGDVIAAGSFTMAGGQPALRVARWIHCPPPGPCYANCDGSTTEPVLTVDDFTCFINEFAAAQNLPHSQQVTHYANCDGSTAAPVLTVDDFTCFINAFAAGCP